MPVRSAGRPAAGSLDWSANSNSKPTTSMPKPMASPFVAAVAGLVAEPMNSVASALADVLDKTTNAAAHPKTRNGRITQ